MSLADLTRPGVLAAIEEYDRLCRDEFLRRYGFGRTYSWSPRPPYHQRRPVEAARFGRRVRLHRIERQRLERRK